MIENLLTDKTKVLEFYKNDLSQDTKESLIQKISVATNLPHELVENYLDKWYFLNSKWYYLKAKDYDFYFINELLGEMISEYFNLATVHYDIACLNSNSKTFYGVASLSFREKNYNYKLASDYSIFPIYSLKNLDSIQSICKTNHEYINLLKSIKKLLIRDFYTLQADRFGNNIFLKEGNDGISLAPLFDYEKSFLPSTLKGTFNHIGKLDISNQEERKILQSDQDFQEQLERLNNISIDKFLKELEERYEIRINEYLKMRYLKHDNKIKTLVKDYQLLK